MTGWADLAPTFAWRKSQRHLLELCSHVTDLRWHRPRHAWRVPKAASARKIEAERFAHAFRQRVPGVVLVRAGTPEATELTLRAARERRDGAVHTLRWTNH